MRFARAKFFHVRETGTRFVRVVLRERILFSRKCELAVKNSCRRHLSSNNTNNNNSNSSSNHNRDKNDNAITSNDDSDGGQKTEGSEWMTMDQNASNRK